MNEDEKPIYIGDTRASKQEQDWLMSHTMHNLTLEQMMELGKAAVEVFDNLFREVASCMDQGRAERVRKMRCEDKYSYRVIAGICHLEWGKDARWSIPTNQIAGMALCAAAAKFFHEDERQYPWQEKQ